MTVQRDIGRAPGFERWSKIFFAGPLDRIFDSAPVGQITPSPMSYKRPALINFARCEVRYAMHFECSADMGGGPRSAKADIANARRSKTKCRNVRSCSIPWPAYLGRRAACGGRLMQAAGRFRR